NFTQDQAPAAVDKPRASSIRTSRSPRACGTTPPGPRRRPQEGLAGIRPGGPFLSAGPRPCWSFALLGPVAAGPRRCWAPSLLGLGAAGPRRCCFLALLDLGAAEAQRRGTRRCEASRSAA